MRRKYIVFSSLVGVLAAVSLTATLSAAQGTKSARGVITAIGPSSLTVSVDGKDMLFNVDDKTTISTPGGSTKTRAAQAEGKEGLKIADFLKVGQRVAVDYHEQGMHAATIRTLSGPAPPPAAGAAPTTGSQNASGVVTAVTGNSLTIKAAAGEVTFTIDDTTDVIAAGASTASRQKQAAGQKTVITDFIGIGDSVAVSYRDAAGAKAARSVRVTSKARK